MIRPLVVFPNNTSKIFVSIPTSSLYNTFDDVVGLYNNSQKNKISIETAFNVPIIGSASIDICYTDKTTFLRENINIDTTTTGSFWADINNWMYLNNYVDIIQSGSNYYINDNTNSSFLYIRNNG